MGVKRNAILGILTLATFIGCGLPLEAQEDQVDYEGFAALTDEVSAYRETRLVDRDAFNKMKAEDGTLVLETRSQVAYVKGHIDGAVHLNFPISRMPNWPTQFPL